MQDRSGATRRGLSSATAARPTAWVLLALCNGELRTYPLPAGFEIVLGRNLDCDVVLEHHRVSQRHARLRVAAAGDTLVVEDLGSRSGTRAGGVLRRQQPALVRPGEPIGIGPFLVAVVRAAARPPTSLVVEEPDLTALPPGLLGIARGSANVLVRGEPGAGAGARVLAEGLHHLSGRGGGFFSIDCAAIAAELLEAELFGDARGAARPGALEAAGEGTLLLEGVGALPPPVQLALLHAIERREVTRVGGAAPISIAARLVCATHGDLLAAVEDGAFRLDLYYRLAGAKITIRQPGVGLLPEEAEERGRVLDALDQCGGNQTRAAKLLGISRSALAAKLSSYRISRGTGARE